MQIGKLIWDYALGRGGVVVGRAYTEEREGTFNIDWEWLVLYDDGELMGADTNDLKAVE
jgi:hypothetical protein